MRDTEEFINLIVTFQSSCYRQIDDQKLPDDNKIKMWRFVDSLTRLYANGHYNRENAFGAFYEALKHES